MVRDFESKMEKRMNEQLGEVSLFNCLLHCLKIFITFKILVCTSENFYCVVYLLTCCCYKFSYSLSANKWYFNKTVLKTCADEKENEHGGKGEWRDRSESGGVWWTTSKFYFTLILILY